MNKKQIIAYLNFLRDDLTNKDEIIDYCINQVKDSIEYERKDKELLGMLKGLVSDVGNLLSEHDIEWQQAGYYSESKKLISSYENES